MGCTVRMDFEGDQWTFFKPFPEDLELLFGIDVHEMQPYRPLPEQAAEQIAQDRTLIVELDSWYLPDTQGHEPIAPNTSRARSWSRASIRASERLRYFHGTGLYELAGEDYRGVFRLGGDFSEDVLPPYTELVRFDAGPCLRGAELREAARTLLRGHLAHRPAEQPLRALRRSARARPAAPAGGRRERLSRLRVCDRQDGRLGVRGRLPLRREWLLGDAAGPASQALQRIVEGCKVLSFRLARRRPFEPESALSALAAAWDRRWSCSMPPSPELAVAPTRHPRARVDGHEVLTLSHWMAGRLLPARTALRRRRTWTG